MTAIYSQQSRTTKLVQVYHRFRFKTQKYANRMHVMKITGLVLGIIAFGMIYIVFVNKASTRGYFHKIESNNLDAVKFDYNLVKLEVMQAEKELWHDVTLSVSHEDPIKILTDVVTITHRGVAFQ